MLGERCSHRCKDLLAKALYLTGITQYLLRMIKQGRGKIVILLYHRVNNTGDVFLPALSEKGFKQQMDLLKRFTRVIPLQQAVNELSNGHDNNNAVVVTIDDSYNDTFKNMFTVFNECEIAATVFLTTANMDTNNPTWPVRLSEMFKNSRSHYLRLNIGGKDRYLSLSTMEDKVRAFHMIKEEAKRLHPQQRESFINQLAVDLEVKFVDGYPKINMSWQQAKEMLPNISFGAHTHTHSILSTLARNEQEFEIRTSQKLIEKNLNREVKFFAYPNGRREDFDQQTVTTLKKLGFSCALTTEEGVNKRGDNLYELRRIYTTEESIEHFALHLLRNFLN